MEHAAFTPVSTPEHFCLNGVTWEQFEHLAQSFEEVGHVKLNYLDGELEILAPSSEEHENRKSTASELLSVYLRSCRIPFYRRGSPRLEKSGQAAVEPDEAYSLGSYQSVPDLVIEIIVTSGDLRKLEIYRRLGVPEAWFWKNGRLRVFVLDGDAYQERERSALLPELDVALLAKHLREPDQYQAVQSFAAALEEPKK